MAVQIAQRWILARLRNETFFSLAALNARIAELVEELNAHPMRKLGNATRKELYERYDRPVLRALPSTDYHMRQWACVRSNSDYHVEFEKHWYSAPDTLAHQDLWLCATARTVELFHRGNRMLTQPTIEKLHALRLGVMAEAWNAQAKNSQMTTLSFDERFGLLVDAEYLARDKRPE